jgi:cytochrome P450
MWQILLAVFLGLLAWLYIRVQKKFNYFASNGVAQDPGFFPLGSNSSWKLATGKLAFTKLTDETYEKFPTEKIVGWYGPFGQPVLIVRDLDLAKNVLIKDFDHFVDRRKMDLSKKTNKYFLEMLVSMTGDKWKRMRAILSPVFTSGKLRAMIPMMNKVIKPKNIVGIIYLNTDYFEGRR